MEHTSCRVALEEVTTPPQADVMLQEAQRNHPRLEHQKEGSTSSVPHELSLSQNNSGFALL